MRVAIQGQVTLHARGHRQRVKVLGTDDVAQSPEIVVISDMLLLLRMCGRFRHCEAFVYDLRIELDQRPKSLS
jgi:hypothetical protein